MIRVRGGLDGKGPRPLPGSARRERHCALPSAARCQPSSVMAVAPTHTGPRQEPGSARRGAALRPPLRCSAPTEERDGRGAHTRGAPARAGLGPAGSGVAPSPPLLGANQVACRPLQPLAWDPARAVLGPAGRGVALPSGCASRYQPSSVLAVALTPVGPGQSRAPPGGCGSAPSPGRGRGSGSIASLRLAHSGILPLIASAGGRSYRPCP